MGIDKKTKKNANDILALENKLQQKEDTINENEIGFSIGFVFNGIDYYYNMNNIKNTKIEASILKNDEKMYVYLKGIHFQQHNVLTLNNDHILDKNVVNIYIVYKLDPITSRDTTFTIQNALFGAMEITKNTDTSKYNCKGYGICFDESEEFTHVRKRGNFSDTTDGRNVIIFGADMSFSKHAYNKANNIYVMGKDYIKKLIILKYMQKKCIIETLQILVKNLY